MRTIATRTLYLVDDPSKTITIEVGAPLKIRGTTDWRCPYRISGLNYDKSGFFYGVDALQALQDCVLLIGLKLDHLNQFRFKGRLRWMSDDNEDFGFGFSLAEDEDGTIDDEAVDD